MVNFDQRNQANNHRSRLRSIPAAMSLVGMIETNRELLMMLSATQLRAAYPEF